MKILNKKEREKMEKLINWLLVLVYLLSIP
jgi:hypothetical protein